MATRIFRIKRQRQAGILNVESIDGNLLLENPAQIHIEIHIVEGCDLFRSPLIEEESDVLRDQSTERAQGDLSNLDLVSALTELALDRVSPTLCKPLLARVHARPDHEPGRDQAKENEEPSDPTHNGEVAIGSYLARNHPRKASPSPAKSPGTTGSEMADPKRETIGEIRSLG